MKKLICYLIFKGKKHLSENSFLHISKNLQKCSKKNSKNSIKLAIVFSTQVFKTHVQIKNKQKRQTFSVLYKDKNRTSSAIKFLIQTIKKEKQDVFYKKFYKEILLILKNDSFIFATKQNLQKQVSFKKNLFLYYR